MSRSDRRARALLAVLAAGSLVCACGGTVVPRAAATRVERRTYIAGAAAVKIELLDDNVVHFEFAEAGPELDPSAPIDTTPMVAKTDYTGPERFVEDGPGRLRTAALAVAVDATSLCITLTDTASNPSFTLTTICPNALGTPQQALSITAEAARDVYGLGEHFGPPGVANGDWFGKTISPGSPVGNALTPFDGGNTGNAQFPVLYALGSAGQSYALFLDHQYAQQWSFALDPWTVQTAGAAIRGYVMGGDLPALRGRYMDLVGHPPVPPRKMFGLWVSEFGYDSWTELEDKLTTLRANHFPVDGFVMDLQWFGGVFRAPSHMGALTWDTTHFPDPMGEIARLRDTQGVGLMLIEEPYVVASRPEFATLATAGYLARACAGCEPAMVSDFWGKGGMVDWTNPAAGDFWHDTKRQPLVDMGILGHWTDLGEPEVYDPSAWYFGFPGLGLHGHADVHNLYNLAWAQSIARGYVRAGHAQRPFILSRSGTSGIQRFGAAMWSGDIGSNLASLAAHLNVQMHMSLSGVDYFGADIGGYYRSALQGDLTDVYTQWFADGMLLDVPGRPHTMNLCNCNETAPDRVGNVPSNLENVRLRYRLIPYLYSLAHRAYLYGEAVFPPLVLYYQDDPNVQGLADEKLLGRDLLVVTSSSDGQTARDVYLPRGTWVDYRSNVWIHSGGEWLRQVPLVVGGLFRLPLFARAGAIIPQMFVDEQTMNALGRRLDGTRRDELIVRVYADATPSRFTLYEDDGATTAYQQGAVRSTPLAQQRAGDTVTVSVGAATGSYDGAPPERQIVVEIVIPEGSATGIDVNGTALAQQADIAALDAADSGWTVADGLIVAKSRARDVGEPTVFTATVR